MNGKTIEITNTDAEGRLVLADALDYARDARRDASRRLRDADRRDERALGDLYAGVFGNDDEWRDQVVAAGEASGDHAWPWPMHRRYRELDRLGLRGHEELVRRGQAQPDLRRRRSCEEFVGEGPWAHVDIAGTGVPHMGRDDYLARGRHRYGVRLIAELATKLSA